MASKGNIPNSTSFNDFEPFWLDLDANQTLSLAINNHELVRIEEEENSNFETEVEKYLFNEISFSWGEKVLMAFEWLFLEVLGNGLIFGMVQYERLGADPMKRRLTDQVSFKLTVSSVLEAAASIFAGGSVLQLEFKGGLYLRAASNTNWPKIGPKLGQK